MRKKKSTRKEWVAILAAIIAAILFICIFLMIETKIMSSYEMSKVVIATVEIEEGTQITKENVETMFKVSEMPTTYVIDGAITKTENLIGHVVENNIHKKEMVSTSDVTDRKTWMESMTEPIEFTFSASSLSSAVAGSIRGGDVIDVGITYQKEDGLAHFESIGRSIYVKEVYSDSGDVVSRSDKETACTMFRVVMEKNEGELLIEKLRTGDEIIVTLPK